MAYGEYLGILLSAVQIMMMALADGLAYSVIFILAHAGLHSYDDTAYKIASYGMRNGIFAT